MAPKEKMPWFSSTMPTVFATRFGREPRGAQPREIEARHHVGDDDDEVAVDLADPRLAVGGVGDRSTASAWVWSTKLYGRIACRIASTDGAGAAGAGQRACASSLTIAGSDSAGSCASALQVREPHRREAGRLDGLEVPAAALDVEDLLVVAEAGCARSA